MHGLIAWEAKTGRLGYSMDKVAKVVELQRIRGGLFESLVSCRFPWVELGFSLDWYPKLLSKATGVNITLDELYSVADRVYALIRAFWIREYERMWSSELNVPPRRWFDESLTKGHYAGLKLDEGKFNELLKGYYELRGWDGKGYLKGHVRRVRLSGHS